jgi:L-ascorbate metabolism protein UlaG (beta-lactamase superfamily)
MNILGLEIEWLGHASFRINEKIYIDPYKVSKGEAELILITHNHFDHYDEKSITAIKKPEAVVIGPEGCLLVDKPVHEGMKFMEKGVRIETVPAYNIGKPFHPRGIGVGYIIEINGVRVYHAGDTDRIPEMKKIKTDIALLPVGGKYTMDTKEAAGAVEDINPKVVIPMHFGKIPSLQANIDDFKKMVKNAEVILLEDINK